MREFVLSINYRTLQDFPDDANLNKGWQKSNFYLNYRNSLYLT